MLLRPGSDVAMIFRMLAGDERGALLELKHDLEDELRKLDESVVELMAVRADLVSTLAAVSASLAADGEPDQCVGGQQPANPAN
jgi:hypothetical protein